MAFHRPSQSATPAHWSKDFVEHLRTVHFTLIATAVALIVMVVCCANHCAYCRAPIVSGQRWVREKIYDPALNGRDPSYHRYHAELFAGQEASCWERHQLEMEIGRTNAYAA